MTTSVDRQEMIRFAQLGLRVCSNVDSRGGQVLTRLFDRLNISLLTLTEMETKLARAEQMVHDLRLRTAQLTAPLTEAREDNARLAAKLRLAESNTPPESFEEATRASSVNPMMAGSCGPTADALIRSNAAPAGRFSR